MYLGKGKNGILREEEIIGIFDLDTASVSPITKAYLAAAQRQGRVDTTGEELPKSFLVLADGRILFTRLSSAILRRRAEQTLYAEEDEAAAY